MGLVLDTSELVAALNALGQKVRAATPAAVRAASAVMEAKVRIELQSTMHPRGTPTPSMPGEPPSQITGALRDSVRVTGPVANASGAMTVLGPTAVYARIQELGGVTGRNHATELPPRPYLRPAYDKTLRDPAFRNAFARVWATAFRA